MSNNFMSKKILAIIPARGGSKGIPRKNIKDFCGKPLIAWAIEAAQKSGVVSRLIISTDDAEIAEVGRKYGAETSFVRPADLAEDKSPTLPVIIHAVKYLLEKENYKPDLVMLLEPTSPGRNSRHIKEAVELILKTGADSIVSVVEVPSCYSPFWQFKIQEDGQMEVFTGGPLNKIISQRQDLPKTYTRNGVIYIFKTELLFDAKPSLYGSDVRAYLMDLAASLDIDTPEDWEEAERKISLLFDI